MLYKQIKFDDGLEFKADGEEGSFEGYASIFGNRDLGGDIVHEGAFQEFNTTKDGNIRVLLQHEVASPIGKASFAQNKTGLKVKGKLLMTLQKAREAYELAKEGILDGMSFAYDILPGGSDFDSAKNTRNLRKLRVQEVSLVTFGMNPKARLISVKSADDMTIREFETFLRDAGWSAQQAKTIASVGFSALTKNRDDDESVDTARLLKTFSGLSIPTSILGVSK